jgi:alpha-tubulin suppressor-like RCC1 family protein
MVFHHKRLSAQPWMTVGVLVAGLFVWACSGEDNAVATITPGSGGQSGGAGTSGAAGTQEQSGSSGTGGSAGSSGQGNGEYQLVAGSNHTCLKSPSGVVRCWGQNKDGQLGYGHTKTIGDDEVPASVGDVDVGGHVMQLAAGARHTCALLDNGKVRCWGTNVVGQLGYGNSKDIGDDEAPASAGDVDVGGKVIQLAAGSGHTCALLDTGKVRCWGYNSEGQLGYANTNSVGTTNKPSQVGDVDVGGKVIQLAAGSLHTCALLDSGKVRCWGKNDVGQLGYGHSNTIGDDETPASAGDIDLGGNAVQLATQRDHTCALLETGKVRCWGLNLFGQLGYGHPNTIGDDETPASVGDVEVGNMVKQLAVGSLHTCALLDTGKVRCWGTNQDGQLGYGNEEIIGDSEPPSSAGDVDVGGKLLQIATGKDHTCALLDTHKIRCWGGNKEGQLGYGNTTPIGVKESPASAGDVHVENED